MIKTILSNLTSGTTLMTRNSNRLSNAVYVRKQDNKHVVVSDFGNEIVLDDKELFSAYSLGEEALNLLSYGFNLDGYYPPLRERWRRQIELITEHLDRLEKEND